MAFIDANKNDYDAYYERCLKLVRKGGLILIDNVLWGGSVANLAEKDEDTKAIRALNAKLKADERVDLTLFAVGDGMTCALKRYSGVAEDRVLDLVARLDAEQRRAAAVDLEHGTHRVLARDRHRSSCGTALAWMCLMVPSAAMNSMSSGIRVFFIQKLTGISWKKSNNMPS